MAAKKEKAPTFVATCGGVTFLIRFLPDREVHVLMCKDEPSLNWTEDWPVGTSKPDP